MFPSLTQLTYLELQERWRNCVIRCDFLKAICFTYLSQDLDPNVRELLIDIENVSSMRSYFQVDFKYLPLFHNLKTLDIGRLKRETKEENLELLQALATSNLITSLSFPSHLLKDRELGFGSLTHVASLAITERGDWIWRLEYLLPFWIEETNKICRFYIAQHICPLNVLHDASRVELESSRHVWGDTLKVDPFVKFEKRHVLHLSRHSEFYFWKLERTEIPEDSYAKCEQWLLSNFGKTSKSGSSRYL